MVSRDSKKSVYENTKEYKKEKQREYRQKCYDSEIERNGSTKPFVGILKLKIKK